ncbi:sugar/nucleoside kinase (ribokinase family) [Bradyrhizobium sp. GM5.1]
MSGPTDGLSPADVDAAADAIRTSRVFVTQLEQPVAAAQLGLEIARAADSITVFNPAPAGAFDDSLFALCDYVVPNETEAEALTGIPVSDLAGARRAGDALLGKGAGTVLITLGEAGALFHGQDRSLHVPSFAAGKGGRNRRRGRCIRRRLRKRARGWRRSTGSGALRFGDSADFRDTRGRCACHAAAR